MKFQPRNYSGRKERERERVRRQRTKVHYRVNWLARWLIEWIVPDTPRFPTWSPEQSMVPPKRNRREKTEKSGELSSRCFELWSKNFSIVEVEERKFYRRLSRETCSTPLYPFSVLSPSRIQHSTVIVIVCPMKNDIAKQPSVIESKNDRVFRARAGSRKLRGNSQPSIL